jgi:phosphoribosylformylglycinamidine synthase
MNETAALFGESASRVIVSLSADNVTEVLQHAAGAHVPARVIGETGGNLLRIAVDGRVGIDMPVIDAERVWSGTIERYFAKRVA